MWSDQYDLHIQATGFGFEGAQITTRGRLNERGGVVYFGTCEDRLVAACGIAVGTGVARTIRSAQALIDHEAEIDPEQLADTGVDLRRLARAAA
jgi:3-phenylpropionate/trans-cinnamate dioxygenase ferredoxin reductase subunit